MRSQGTGLRSQASLILIVSLLFSAAAGTSNPLQSVEQKFAYIRQNGQREKPNSRPIQITEQEINAYLASGEVKLPAGVESVRLNGVSGVVTAQTRVDFDKVRAGRNSSNPLLQLFSGVHEVVVEAQASGANYQGRVHVNSVSIDGVEVPHFALKLFVDNYVTSKYPGVGLDSIFQLPDKIESATVGTHVLTVIQR